MPSLTRVQTGFVEAQGALPLSSGTAAAPGLKFDDHAGTGMFSPSTGEIAFSTSGHSQAITFKTDGKVGIGTDNPSTNLHVVGSVRATGAFDLRDTAGNVVLFVEDASNDARISNQTAGEDIVIRTTPSGGSATERLRITSAGLVGIGTDNPAVALHVIGDITMEDNSPRLEMHDANAANTLACTGGIELFDSAGNRGAYMGATEGSGFLSFGISPSAGAAPTEKLRITSAGDVGIGEDSPVSRLHLANSGSGNVSMTITNDTTGHTGGNGVEIGMGAGEQAQIWNYENSYFRIGTNNTEKLRITSDGKVLINSTANSNATMVVRGLTDNTHPVIKFGGTSSNGYTFFGDEYQTDESQFTMGCAYSASSIVIGWGVKVSTSANNVYLSSQDTYATKHSAIRHDGNGWAFLSNSSSQTVTTDSAVTLTERLRITSDGNLGIGTDSVPTNFRVEISEPGSVGLNLRNTNNSAGDSGRIAFSQGSGNLASANTFADIIATADTVSPLTGRILFRTNQGNNLIERMRIDSSGNVGIGTSVPAALLHLSGSNNGNQGTNNDNIVFRFEDTDPSSGSGGQMMGSIEWSGNDTTTYAAGVRSLIQCYGSASSQLPQLRYRSRSHRFFVGDSGLASAQTTDALLIDSTGAIILPNGSPGIQFGTFSSPATSTNLDDYEEGTWTPIFSTNTGGASGQTYQVQRGRYTKIGRIVNCTFDMQLSNKGTFSGSYITLGGIPYTNMEGGNCGGTMTIGYHAGFTLPTGGTTLTSYNDSTNVYIMTPSDASGSVYLTVASAATVMSATSRLIGQITLFLTS